VIRRRTVLTTLGATLAAGALTRSHAQGGKEKIAILGTGRMGQALATCWVRSGHSIVFGSRTPTDERVQKVAKDLGAAVTVATSREAAAQAPIVVFTLPWLSVKDLVPTLGDLSGKIIIDPMNAPLKIVDGYPARSDEPTSVSEQLQALMPAAKVVKAFNTPTSANVLNPARAGGHVSIPLAGTDVTAKARVAELVTQIGLEPLDIGPLVAARYLEDLLRLGVGYVIYTKGKFFEYHLAPVKT
jgi:8-hydroxy-5-deazaflavin:NADPH oxidoreductase